MFSKCSELTELNLCSFNTSNVTRMGGMFQGTISLTGVYVGEKWITDSADTTSMFDSSGVSSVTTGQCN